MIIAKVLDALYRTHITKAEKAKLMENYMAALDITDLGDEIARNQDTSPFYRYVDALPAWMVKDVFEKSIGQYKFQHLCRKLDGEDWKDALWLTTHQYHGYAEKLVSDDDRIMGVD